MKKLLSFGEKSTPPEASIRCANCTKECPPCDIRYVNEIYDWEKERAHPVPLCVNEKACCERQREALVGLTLTRAKLMTKLMYDATNQTRAAYATVTPSPLVYDHRLTDAQNLRRANAHLRVDIERLQKVLEDAHSAISLTKAAEALERYQASEQYRKEMADKEKEKTRIAQVETEARNAIAVWKDKPATASLTFPVAESSAEWTSKASSAFYWDQKKIADGEGFKSDITFERGKPVFVIKLPIS